MTRKIKNLITAVPVTVLIVLAIWKITTPSVSRTDYDADKAARASFHPGTGMGWAISPQDEYSGLTAARISPMEIAHAIEVRVEDPPLLGKEAGAILFITALSLGLIALMMRPDLRNLAVRSASLPKHLKR